VTVDSDEERDQGIPLKLDPEAESADASLPAFLARPEGAPCYHGFPLLEETRTDDGWCYGTISSYDHAGEGWTGGDAYVVAPDNTRAGIVWSVGEPSIECLDGQAAERTDRWAVYLLTLPRPVRCRSDLVTGLMGWLPEFRRRFDEWRESLTQDRR
jgi:hypothetical protein